MGKMCAKVGWVSGLKFLKHHNVPILWAPMFASMKGQTDVLTWIEETTTYLNSVTVAMECTSYAIQLGSNPKAAIWLLERSYIDPKFVMQSAIDAEMWHLWTRSINTSRAPSPPSSCKR